MKHISIIVPAGESVLSSIVGSYKVFNGVNDFLIQSGQREDNYFHIDLVGLNKETSLYNGAFNVRPTKTIDQVTNTDLIIVTSITGNYEEELKKNYDFVPWIREHRIKNNAEVASLCTGAFILAETGLLNGKSCATHWIAADAFRSMYPHVNLLGSKVINEDNGIYSSGGAYSFLNLLLHLVEKYCGRETAIWCSKLFEIEFNRDNQNQFVIFRGQKDHADESIKNAQLYIEKNFEEKLNVESLANLFSISRRNFVRRFKKATTNTPLEYIQRVKIEAAKKSLESSTKNVNEVMWQVGYNDTKAFRNVFRKYTGLSPMDYRNKYNREMVMALYSA
ncbi:MAG: helix-turn-helix domain-containing protein [Bacteroidetes bacterium]|nr:helix-turn-helix domain-containing protein [Bacteroidota bacterium]